MSISHPKFVIVKVFSICLGVRKRFIFRYDAPNPYFMPQGKHISDMDALEVARLFWLRMSLISLKLCLVS